MQNMERFIYLMRVEKRVLIPRPLTTNRESAQKGGYRSMDKEIYEQSRVIEDTLLGKSSDDEVYFEELDRTLEDIERYFNDYASLVGPRLSPPRLLGSGRILLRRRVRNTGPW